MDEIPRARHRPIAGLRLVEKRMLVARKGAGLHLRAAKRHPTAAVRIPQDGNRFALRVLGEAHPALDAMLRV